MLNGVFLFLVIAGTLTAAFTGKMQAVTDASIDNAKTAVDLAINLIGQMALWLGVMRVVEDAGFLATITRGLSPIVRRLFPSIPGDHPAIGAMILNIAANVMGLTNAATPFGIKAMIELNKLNKRPGVATNAMCLFLAINTSGVAVLPTGAIAVRASAGATDATGIFWPTILSTMASTLVAIVVAKLLERLPFFSVDRYATSSDDASSDDTSSSDASSVAASSSSDGSRSGVSPSEGRTEEKKPSDEVKGLAEAEAKLTVDRPVSWPRLGVSIAILGALFVALSGDLTAEAGKSGLMSAIRTLSGAWILPLILVSLLLAGFSRRVKVYESLVNGAKEAFDVGKMIIPFLVAILVAIGMFRASGAMDAIVHFVGPYTEAIGVPAEVLPMALIRPLSGSGALAVVLETMKTYGPDSIPGFTVSVMAGSTETTFYVLAVYFGAVRVRATRHAVFACLAADIVGLYLAVQLARVFH